MKNLILLLLFVLNYSVYSQNNATDFTTEDCNGVMHNLFDSLDAGNIIVISWVMPCGPCATYTLPAYNAVQSFSLTHPGIVDFYLVDDYANTACASITNWASNYNMPIHTAFSSPVINEENQHIFKNLMEKSYFSLCPRGYGVTSYRLFESFQFSTVPVYISEEKDYYLPFEDIIDWEKLCVLQDINSIKHLPKRLNDIINSGKYKSMLEYGAYCNNNFFNYDFITKYIIEKIESF